MHARQWSSKPATTTTHCGPLPMTSAGGGCFWDWAYDNNGFVFNALVSVKQEAKAGNLFKLNQKCVEDKTTRHFQGRFSDVSKANGSQKQLSAVVTWRLRNQQVCCLERRILLTRPVPHCSSWHKALLVFVVFFPRFWWQEIFIYLCKKNVSILSLQEEKLVSVPFQLCSDHTCMNSFLCSFCCEKEFLVSSLLFGRGDWRPKFRLASGTKRAASKTILNLGPLSRDKSTSGTFWNQLRSSFTVVD